MTIRHTSRQSLGCAATADGTARSRLLIGAVALAMGLLPWVQVSAMEKAADTAKLTPDQQVAQLDTACAAAQDAMAARQAARPLYDRLGGRDAIHAVVEDVVRRHQSNAAISSMFNEVDVDKLVKHVTDFLSSAFGGDVEYTGRDMVTTHASLGLTNADLLAAGADVESALVAAGVRPDEIQEVMCAFVSLRGAVVTK